MITSRLSRKSTSSFQVRAGSRAFSLIELLLVLVILSVLAAIIMPKFTSKSEQARVTSAKTTISSFETALNTFEIDNGRFPTTAEGFESLMVSPPTLTSWGGPYLSKADFNDPWGNPFHYSSPGQHNTSGFDIYSNGPDMVEGTDDDITNW